MASNFMKKVKTPPKPAKPIAKPIKPAVKIESEVKKDEQQKIADEKIEQVEKIEQEPEPIEEVVQEESQPEPEVVEQKEKAEEQTVEVEPEPIEEEVVEEKQEEIKPEPVAEDKPKKKKSTNRKKTEKKTEESVKENKEPVAIEQAEDIMLDTIMPCASGWNEEKERVGGLLDKIVITEELDPTSVKALLADMSSALRELIMLSTEAKTAYSNLKDTIEEVKVANSTGANSEERKLNGLYAQKNYEKDGQVVDLTELQKFYRERQEFYDAAVRQIEINRQMLITFGSVFKIELAKAY